MPSSSPAQKRTMAAVAHGWKPPASSGINIPVSVAKEFNAADKAKSAGHVARLRGVSASTSNGGGAAGS